MGSAETQPTEDNRTEGAPKTLLQEPLGNSLQGSVFYFTFSFERVDPNCFGKICGCGNAAHETFRIVLPCTLKRFFSGHIDLGGLTVVQR